MSVTSHQQIRILHVDDDPDLAEMVAEFLEHEDGRFSVETTTSASEGLERFSRSDFDCIISDYDLPGRNGIEFLEAVREEHPYLPFILYTGKGSEEVASQAISAGVTDYLRKQSGTEDASLLAHRIVQAVNSQRPEGKKKFLRTLENELTELSIELLRNKESDIDVLINDTLEKLGTLVDADRTYIFDIDSEAGTLSNTHEWCSASVEPQIEMLQDIPQDTLSWWTQKLKNSDKVTIPNVSELPPEAEAEQEILQKQNIESLIITPIISNERLVGFIGLDWVEGQGVWSDEFTNILRMTSELITTARKRKERERELHLLKQFIDNASVPITLADTSQEDNPLVYVNDGFEGMTGYSPEETLGRNCRFLQGEDTDSETVAALREAIDNEETISVELRNYRKDGTEFWNRLTVTPIYDDEDNLVRYLGTQENITERKKHEQELQTTKEQLEILNRILRHDIQNDVQVIQAWAEKLQTELPETHQDELRRILWTNESIKELTQNGGELIESFTQKGMETEAVRLDEIVKGELNSARSRYSNADFTVEGPLPVAVVSANGTLSSVVRNLLNNAVQHNQNQVVVTVRIEQVENSVRLLVIDNGPGVPDDQKQEIFGKGERGLESSGTGIGLYLVNQLVQSYRGDVWVEDNEQYNFSRQTGADSSGGAVFIVELPTHTG